MEPESKTIHILLVEDDEDDYLILREYLMELRDHTKYELEWAQTYQAGLEKIQSAKHDIYLIDHHLGERTGLDLLQEAIQAGCQEPIIMVTGQTEREIDQAAMIAGATDYLIKGRMDGQLLERSMRYALERSRLLKKISELALRDPLTGLYNRRELYRFLDYELAKSQRYGHPLSLLMMDIDRFKEFNDQYGHRTGDEILQHVSQVLQSNIRSCDLLARYGGDEFIVVLPETGGSQVWQGSERLRNVIESLSIKITNEDGYSEIVEVSISIGMAEYPSDASSIDELIDAADQALYQAKRMGCNRVIRFHALNENDQGAK